MLFRSSHITDLELFSAVSVFISRVKMRFKCIEVLEHRFLFKQLSLISGFTRLVKHFQIRALNLPRNIVLASDLLRFNTRRESAWRYTDTLDDDGQNLFSFT